MAKPLNQKFFEWLKKDPISLLDTIAIYDCLDIRFSSSNELKVYFKGCLILTISDKIITDSETTFKILSERYYSEEEQNTDLIDIINKGVTISNLQDYLDRAISLLSRRSNIRVEDCIRQEITRVNNCSSEAQDTDYFIVDEEYNVSIKGPRFDLIALKWDSKGEERKHFSSKSNLEIVIFEVKRGTTSTGGTKNASSENADLKKHQSDFCTFISDEARLAAFKLDIVKMFVQQASLKGFYNAQEIKGLKNVSPLAEAGNEQEIEGIAKNIPVKFGIICSDFKQKSQTLKAQIEQMPEDFLFATASFMGYGLYSDSMLNREQILEILG
ncbi:MAG: hypothetical protein K2G23_04355 [Muribaculaceae bacterium]|nr:hypothetical protein [Muribaculaceae bacterium]